jgi:tetratricopeptide (TPR) repeat protein
MKFELDNSIYEKIKYFSKNGDIFQNNKDFENAIKMYKQALELIPEPKTSWEASTWIKTAIGETYFFMKNYEAAEQSLVEAVKCPGGKENPFIHLRLGQTYFELAKFKEAKKELTSAYILDPYSSLFEGEDLKYYNLIRNNKHL